MILSADTWHSIASFALLLSLAVGVISSAIIVYTGNIKEKRFKQELSQNSIELGETMLELGNTKLEVEQAKLETAKNNKIAKTAELELEKLRIKLRNRSLTAKQCEIIVSSLSKFSGKLQISIKFATDDESSEYAEQIISVLKDSGIVIKKVLKSFTWSPQYGIIISNDPEFSIIKNAFKKAKIDFTTADIDFGIFIGSKPPIDP